MRSRALLSVCFVALLVGSSGFAAAVPVDDVQSTPANRTVTDQASGVSNAQSASDAVTGPLVGDRAQVAPSLRDATGTVEVIVRVKPTSQLAG